MEDHREGNAGHLSDEQFTELLMGGSTAQVQAHLAECAECRAEAERVGGAIGDFSEQSRLWAERRAATRAPRTAEQTARTERGSVMAWLVRPQSWLARPQAWAGAALAIALAVGIGVTMERAHSRTAQSDAAKTQVTARVEATAVQAQAAKAQAGATLVQAKAAVQAEAAVRSATLKADNALLSAIDGELRADESAPASLYGLTADTSGSGTKSARTDLQLMRAGRGQFARVAVIAVCLAVGAGPTMQAQGRGGGGPGGGGPGGGGPGGGGPGGGGPGGGGMGGPQFPGGGPGGGVPGMGGPGPVGGPPPQQRGPGPEGRPGLQLGPPGRWWDDRATVKSLRLSPEQRTRMDAIFEQNRGALQSRFENVRQAEMQMEELARSDAPAEAALFAQIDRVAQARAELEKANTHLLLQLRREMDAEQIRRLEKMR